MRWLSAELLAVSSFALAVYWIPGWWKLLAVLALPFAVAFARRYLRPVATRIRRMPAVQAAGAYLLTASPDETRPHSSVE